MNWQFQYTEAAFLFIAAGLLLLLFLNLLRWKRSVTRRIGDPVLVKQLLTPFSQKRFVLRFVLVLDNSFSIMTDKRVVGELWVQCRE